VAVEGEVGEEVTNGGEGSIGVCMVGGAGAMGVGSICASVAGVGGGENMLGRSARDCCWCGESVAKEAKNWLIPCLPDITSKKGCGAIATPAAAKLSGERLATDCCCLGVPFCTRCGEDGCFCRGAIGRGDEERVEEGLET